VHQPTAQRAVCYLRSYAARTGDTDDCCMAGGLQQLRRSTPRSSKSINQSINHVFLEWSK